MTATTKALSKKALTKPKLLITGPQGTQAWQLMRCGKVTASRIADVMSYKKNGEESNDRRQYRMQIVTEMLTGLPTDYGFESFDMKWGKEQEPFARLIYGDLAQSHVDQIAFAQHPQILHAGASPDGLIGKDGLLEIKCPRSFTHINYILDDVVPEDYKPQMLWQMACTGRAWCDFMSYDPRMPENLRVFIKRFNRDNAVIETITKEVNKFIDECRALVTTLEHYASALAARS
jgi:putative phage-type endonuclease